MGDSGLRQIFIGGTLVSILLSLMLYWRGRKEDAIFVGLWAPTVISLAESLLGEVED